MLYRLHWQSAVVLMGVILELGLPMVTMETFHLGVGRWSLKVTEFQLVPVHLLK